MKLRKKFNKVTAWILTCILFFTMAFSITSEAYGEGYTHAKQFKNCHIYNGIDVSKNSRFLTLPARRLAVRQINRALQ